MEHQLTHEEKNAFVVPVGHIIVGRPQQHSSGISGPFWIINTRPMTIEEMIAFKGNDDGEVSKLEKISNENYKGTGANVMADPVRPIPKKKNSKPDLQKKCDELGIEYLVKDTKKILQRKIREHLASAPA